MITLKRSLLFIGIILFSLNSCRVKWVPDYNSQLEEQIALVAKMTDRLYLDILDVNEDKRRYENYAAKYTEIESEINSIKLKNEARNNNEHFIQINSNLKQAFDEARKYHKEHITLSSGEIKSYQGSLAAFWLPLYLAERGLKNSKDQ